MVNQPFQSLLSLILNPSPCTSHGPPQWSTNHSNHYFLSFWTTTSHGPPQWSTNHSNQYFLSFWTTVLVLHTVHLSGQPTIPITTFSHFEHQSLYIPRSTSVVNQPFQSLLSLILNPSPCTSHGPPQWSTNHSNHYFLSFWIPVLVLHTVHLNGHFTRSTSMVNHPFQSLLSLILNTSPCTSHGPPQWSTNHSNHYFLSFWTTVLVLHTVHLSGQPTIPITTFSHFESQSLYFTRSTSVVNQPFQSLLSLILNPSPCTSHGPPQWSTNHSNQYFLSFWTPVLVLHTVHLNGQPTIPINTFSHFNQPFQSLLSLILNPSPCTSHGPPQWSTNHSNHYFLSFWTPVLVLHTVHLNGQPTIPITTFSNFESQSLYFTRSTSVVNQPFQSLLSLILNTSPCTSHGPPQWSTNHSNHYFLSFWTPVLVLHTVHLNGQPTIPITTFSHFEHQSLYFTRSSSMVNQPFQSLLSLILNTSPCTSHGPPQWSTNHSNHYFLSFWTPVLVLHTVHLSGQPTIPITTFSHFEPQSLYLTRSTSVVNQPFPSQLSLILNHSPCTSHGPPQWSTNHSNHYFLSFWTTVLVLHTVLLNGQPTIPITTFSHFESQSLYFTRSTSMVNQPFQPLLSLILNHSPCTSHGPPQWSTNHSNHYFLSFWTTVLVLHMVHLSGQPTIPTTTFSHFEPQSLYFTRSSSRVNQSFQSQLSLILNHSPCTSHGPPQWSTNRSHHHFLSFWTTVLVLHTVHLNGQPTIPITTFSHFEPQSLYFTRSTSVVNQPFQSLLSLILNSSPCTSHGPPQWSTNHSNQYFLSFWTPVLEHPTVHLNGLPTIPVTALSHFEHQSLYFTRSTSMVNQPFQSLLPLILNPSPCTSHGPPQWSTNHSNHYFLSFWTPVLVLHTVHLSGQPTIPITTFSHFEHQSLYFTRSSSMVNQPFQSLLSLILNPSPCTSHGPPQWSTNHSNHYFLSFWTTVLVLHTVHLSGQPTIPITTFSHFEPQSLYFTRSTSVVNQPFQSPLSLILNPSPCTSHGPPQWSTNRFHHHFLSFWTPVLVLHTVLLNGQPTIPITTFSHFEHQSLYFTRSTSMVNQPFQSLLSLILNTSPCTSHGPPSGQPTIPIATCFYDTFV